MPLGTQDEHSIPFGHSHAFETTSGQAAVTAILWHIVLYIGMLSQYIFPLISGSAQYINILSTKLTT